MGNAWAQDYCDVETPSLVELYGVTSLPVPVMRAACPVLHHTALLDTDPLLSSISQRFSEIAASQTGFLYS